MNLTEDYQALVHLIARAFARTHGSEDPATFADTVTTHAKAINEEDENGKPESDYVVQDNDLPLLANEHKNYLPDELPKSDEQTAIDATQADAQHEVENDHDQTIQQIHGDQSQADADAERAAIEQNKTA